MFHNSNEKSNMSAPEITPFYQLRQLTHNYQHSPSMMEYIPAELFKQIAGTIPEKL